MIHKIKVIKATSSVMTVTVRSFLQERLITVIPKYVDAEGDYCILFYAGWCNIANVAYNGYYFSDVMELMLADKYI